MKVLLQMCDDGRKFHIALATGARYGTFEIKRENGQSIIHVGSKQHAPWMLHNALHNKLAEAYDHWLATTVVGTDGEQPWFEVHVDYDDHTLDAARYALRL